MAMASPPLSTSTSVLCSRLKGTVCCSKLQMGGGGGVLRGWCGLKNLGVRGKGVQVKVKKGLWKGKVVYASLFGVGAPEALVIGVVALLVFGPKGLAEVARNLGKTLRAFQPTIRELQDVSREFKSTLTREIGLDDDISTPTPTPTNTFNSSDPSQSFFLSFTFSFLTISPTLCAQLKFISYLIFLLLHNYACQIAHMYVSYETYMYDLIMQMPQEIHTPLRSILRLHKSSSRHLRHHRHLLLNKA
ncbi:hypothetical protein PIB30_027340 [Stylosanthes scabra]|uniref:Sec-independent protein translocase protein TATB, chloroplastic n=1 Tax=Stylosanthes scabra TaxID=79078 RepID=A0ABU6RAW8_9FABA|nr:hypothetical protein [Stylosanthes scabra]